MTVVGKFDEVQGQGFGGGQEGGTSIIVRGIPAQFGFVLLLLSLERGGRSLLKASGPRRRGPVDESNADAGSEDDL
ncbi:MAG: hypothetical protein WKF82_02170 [Nocardioidaceae bacterium]